MSDTHGPDISIRDAHRESFAARLGKVLLGIVGGLLVLLVYISPIPLIAGITLYLAYLVLKPFFAKRQEPGLCRKCGYDIRASRERCPECGVPFSPRDGVRYRDVTPQR